MGQQISMDDALAAFREQHGKLADENVLLRAQVTGLERRIAELQQHGTQSTAGEEAQPAPAPYLSGEPV